MIRDSSSLSLITKPTKTWDEKGTYKIYGHYNKLLSYIPSYAYLAICRAEEEKQLSVSLDRSVTKLLKYSHHYFLPRNASDLVELLNEALEDGIKRLLIPSMEREYR
jgi:protein Tex